MSQLKNHVLNFNMSQDLHYKQYKRQEKAGNQPDLFIIRFAAAIADFRAKCSEEDRLKLNCILAKLPEEPLSM